MYIMYIYISIYLYIIYIYIIYIYLYLSLLLSFSLYIVIVCDHEITRTSYAICRDKIYITFYGPFFGMQLPQG